MQTSIYPETKELTISDELRACLRTARSVCVLTGAGISAESGVPTFRGAEGLWKKFRPEELANFDAFVRNPQLVWEWYAYRRTLMKTVQPNAGHQALAELEALIPDTTIVTQNVDNLHCRAGSKNVIELHGNIERSYCIACGKFQDTELEEEADGVPKCPACGGLVRPDVVWFGELLPQEIFEEAERTSKRAELFLCVGTSVVVYPAASLPLVAREAGAYVVEINPEPTELSSRVDESLRGKSGAIVPALLQLLKSSRGDL
jgi:NAD-dependent deacetylase